MTPHEKENLIQSAKYQEKMTFPHFFEGLPQTTMSSARCARGKNLHMSCCRGTAARSQWRRLNYSAHILAQWPLIITVTLFRVIFNTVLLVFSRVLTVCDFHVAKNISVNIIVSRYHLGYHTVIVKDRQQFQWQLKVHYVRSGHMLNSYSKQVGVAYPQRNC